MAKSNPKRPVAQSIRSARSTLASLGWSYRAVTQEYGGPLAVSYSHLSKALAGIEGRMLSRSVLEEIERLPSREAWESNNGNFKAA
jgi:hypothetical protein